MTTVTNATVDSIGETTAILRATGDDAGGTMFMAIREATDVTVDAAQCSAEVDAADVQCGAFVPTAQCTIQNPTLRGYLPTEQDEVRNGTDADWFNNDANSWRTSLVASGLQVGRVQAWGTFVDDGAESPVVNVVFSTKLLLPKAVGGRALPRGELA